MASDQPRKLSFNHLDTSSSRLLFLFLAALALVAEASASNLSTMFAEASRRFACEAEESALALPTDGLVCGLALGIADRGKGATA